MSASESDSCDSEWDEQFLFAVSMKQGKGLSISEKQRIGKMKEALNRGADINTTSKKGNTALHIAVQKDYRDVIEFLHEKRASTNIPNHHGFTAITLAERLHRTEIADFLKKPYVHKNERVKNQSRSSTGNMPVDDARPSTSGEGYLPSPRDLPTRLERHTDVAVDTDATGSGLSRDPKLARTTDKTFQPSSIAGGRTYAQSSLKQGFHGYAYQWKHLMLVLHRARQKGYLIRLDTELDAAGKFEDVVLEYKNNEGKKALRLMQIKHKADHSKLITADFLEGKPKVSDDAFNILNYFISWREIKERQDPIFEESTSKEFILCTNIGLDVTGLNVEKLPTDELLDSKRPPDFYKLVDVPFSVRNKLISEASASEEDISNFCTEFILAVNQPEEDELEEMIKCEIRAYSQFNLKNMNFIWSSFQNHMVNWLKKSKNHSKFLSKTDADDFFDAMERELSCLTTVGLNLIYRSELKEYDINFELENGDLRKFLDSPSSEQGQILELISSKQTLLTALRVHQSLEDCGKYEEKDSLIFIRLKELLFTDIMNEVLRSFESPHSYDLIVIDCASSRGIPNAQELWNCLYRIIETKRRKRMILIIQGNNDAIVKFGVGCKIVHEKDCDISIDNLKECSRKTLLERRIIKFQGHVEPTSFGRLLGIANCGNIESEKLSSLRRMIDHETLTQLIQGEKEILIGGEVRGLCEVEKYYIPRTITGHVVIKRSVLKDPKIPDLFAISGIDFESLEKLLGLEEGTHEFDECNETKLDPDKCCFLEKDQAEDHFKNICEQNSERNIHWLQVESEKLLWKKSHGNITDLMAFEQTVVDDKNDERLRVSYFTEDQLMHFAEKCRIVIISDNAGMGKSTVLTHFAEKMKEKHPSPLVIQVDLSRHTTELNELKEQEQTFDTDNAVDFLVNKLSGLKTELEREVFKEIIKVTGKAVLLLDGFDEISPEFECTVTELLEALSRLNVKMLCVTTRSHTVGGLEKKLETFSHNLLPFNSTNQVDFLKAFWGRGINPRNYDQTKKRLEEHVSSVLQILDKSINHQLQEFIGIPLLTRMVAEVFPFDEKVNPEYFDPSNEAIDIIEIYRRFVDEKYKIYRQEKIFADDTNQGQNKEREKLHQLFLMTHKKLALEALFDEETVIALLSCQPEIETMCSFFQVKNEGEERIGIVTQVISGKPHFIHRTFAEYFAAEFIIDTLMDCNGRNQLVQKFFIIKLFVEDKYKLIRKFLNTLLSSRDDVSDNEKKSWKCSLRKHHGPESTTLYHVAVNEDHLEIIRFFSHRLSKNRTDEALLDVEGSCGELSYHDSLQEEADIDIDNAIGYTPLILAIENNNLPLVKYLIDAGANLNYRKDLHNHPVIKHFDDYKRACAANAIIHPIDEYGWTTLNHAVQIGNLDIVRCLLEAGADINCQMDNGWTPLHHAVKLEDLEMVKLLVENHADINFQYTVELSELVCLHPEVLEDLKFVIMDVWMKLEYDNYVPGESPLHFAAKTTNLDMVTYLIQRGADINSRSALGWTPLHVAVATNNMDIVECLVRNGVDINITADYELTPLQIAVHLQHLDMVQCLVRHGVNFNSEVDYGLTTLQHVFHGLILRMSSTPIRISRSQCQTAQQ